LTDLYPDLEIIEYDHDTASLPREVTATINRAVISHTIFAVESADYFCKPPSTDDWIAAVR
jgi:hypothetical protein